MVWKKNRLRPYEAFDKKPKCNFPEDRELLYLQLHTLYKDITEVTRDNYVLSFRLAEVAAKLISSFP